MHMTILGDRGRGDQQGCPHQEGGPKLLRFESPRWRPKSSSSPSRISEAVPSKLMPRAHMDSVFDDPYMLGNII
jgi:hypothetical protein